MKNSEIVKNQGIEITVCHNCTHYKPCGTKFGECVRGRVVGLLVREDYFCSEGEKNE